MNLTNADLFCTYTDRTNIKSTIIKLKRIFLPCDFFTVPIPDSSFNYAFAPVRLYLQIIDIVQKNGSQMPYPTQMVILDQEPKTLHPDP